MTGLLPYLSKVEVKLVDEPKQKRSLGFDDVMAMLTISILIIVTTANVFMRYVMHKPFEWSEEVQIILFIWTVFFGAASVMKAEGHVGIDIFVQYLPARAKKAIRIFDNLVVAVILIITSVLGIKLAIDAWVKITPILGIKYTFIDLAVPVGGVLMLYQIAKKTWREFSRKEVTKS